MDIGTSIISILGIGILIGPFVLSAVRQHRNTNSLYQDLQKLAATKQSTIDQSEVCYNKIIGLDTKKDFVFLFKRNNGKVFSNEINLKEVGSCALNKKVQTFQKGASSDSYISEITLKFTLNDKSKTAITWVLFDLKEENQISDELMWGKKWEATINKIIKGKS